MLKDQQYLNRLVWKGKEHPFFVPKERNDPWQGCTGPMETKLLGSESPVYQEWIVGPGSPWDYGWEPH